MNKKIISSILAGACALSCMSMSAFANDGADDATLPGPSKQTYSINSLVAFPELDVTLPATEDVAAVLNPFGLKVDNVADAADLDIYSAYYDLENNGDSPVQFTFTVTGTAAGEAKLVSAAPAATSTTKDVFMYINASTESKPGKVTKGTYVEATSLLVTAKETSKALLILDENGGTKDAGWFQITGEINTADTLKTPWTAKDGVKLKLIIDAAPSMTGTT